MFKFLKYYFILFDYIFNNPNILFIIKTKKIIRYNSQKNK